MRRLAGYVAALAAGLALGYFLRNGGPAPGVITQPTQTNLTESNAQLTAEIERLRTELSRAQSAAPAAVAPGQARGVSPGTSPADDAVTRAELVKLVDEKQARLASTQAAFEAASKKLAELEAEIEPLRKEATELRESSRALEERLAAANKVATALEAESKSQGERLQSLTAANRELRERGDRASRSADSMTRLVDDMDDLNRRREVHLNSLLRRYREITDLYRGVATRIDTIRDNAPAGGTDLSRIQNAIGLAEEDLRQLQTINAQAAKLRRDVAAARQSTR